MESTHRELCAGLTDGLSRNDPHRFTNVDQTTATQVTSVAFGAKTKAGCAVERCAHFDFVNTTGLDLVQIVFVQHFTGRHNHLAGLWVHHVINGRAAQNTVSQRLDDLTTLNDRTHQLSICRTAIGLGHHQVLRHIDQAACQVA